MLKALIVEDEVALLMLYERVLSQIGYETITAKDGNVAIQLLQNGCIPDLMVLDIRLPNCNGVQVLEYLKTWQDIQQSHVIIASASRDFENSTGMLPSCEFLLKPVLASHLIEIAVRVHGLKEL